jgi:Mn-dependent DtxR family transcriptional regulator
MQVSKEGIERIRAANPILRVLAERGIEVSRKGKSYLARCPFHSPDHTPSMGVTPGKGLFHCFTCGEAGDVFGLVVKRDKVSFPDALRLLATRAGLNLDELMQRRERAGRPTPVEALTPPPFGTGPNRQAHSAASPAAAVAPTGEQSDPEMVEPEAPPHGTIPAEVLARVVEHYHETFCDRADAQQYLIKRGLTDPDLLRALKVGYADGSLLKMVPKHGELRDQLMTLGVITAEGRELLGGCIVVPIADPVTGAWTSLYGRGIRMSRHCYLPGPLRGVVNYQAARSSSEVILAESVLDALSFHQAGIATAIPLYGVNGFTPDHLDILKRERVDRVILALDNDDVGRRATAGLRDKLEAAGVAVRVASYPTPFKDANELLVSCNGNAGDVFRRMLDDAEPRPAPKAEPPPSSLKRETDGVVRYGAELVLERGTVTYRARTHKATPGRLRATVRASKGVAFHVDTVDLYASRSRSEFARRAAKTLGIDESTVESALLALLVEAEHEAKDQDAGSDTPQPVEITAADRADALALLRRPDLLDQVGRDVDAIGYVGEETNKRLLYLVAVSRKLADPLSAIVLSQSGAGKSGITEVIERLTPPEDVVLLTRLTPQSLYYVAPGFLDQKLVIVEERHGSQEADYSIRVLQSRKKLIAAAPVKDPATGNLRTKVFTVEARAAFIEATTATSVNHENATRCFELSMDESVEQTQRIHERQRLMKTEAGLRLRREGEVIARRHWNAQRLLETLPVVIPFADQLTFPASWMRTRRDNARFLNLIEVSAFLHQHQRPRRDGVIVASVADYEIAYDLASQLLTETLSDVKKSLRDAYTRIRDLSLKREEPVSRREIREALQVPDSTVRRWLAELVELEYLTVTDQGQRGAGKTTRYRVIDREPEDGVVGLLRPDQIRP